MPELFVNDRGEARHTEDLQDIITTVPAWILRWGITLFFLILILIFSLSAFIRYPDIVKTSIRIESPNSPKPIITKVPGKLVRILINENEQVKAEQPLAYLESTANHDAVLKLLENLRHIQKQVNSGKVMDSNFAIQAEMPSLGELQISYQVFFQEYLAYKSAVTNGFELKKKSYLQNDLINLNQQHEQLEEQKTLQLKDYTLAGQEYDMHKKLKQEKVETTAEFRQAESKYLLQKSPLIQTESALIAEESNYAAKQKEILELDNQITEEKAKFFQGLNSLISQSEDWKAKYVLSASQDGKISYAGIIQENKVFNANETVFYVNPGNEQFFGEMAIPQENMGKVKKGQEVLIKLKSYPFEQFGMIRGKINHIADVPYKDSIFMSKVCFNVKNRTDSKRSIHLKQGMLADAEIITQDASILQRITWNLLKLIRQD